LLAPSLLFFDHQTSIFMDALVISGGIPLSGTIAVSGAKNAALPLMVATLLTDAPLRLDNVPDLADIATLTALLQQHGTTVTRHPDDRSLHLHTPTITSTTAPYDLVRKMRASVLVLGPLLARCGEAKVSLPGGCAIGTRPVDLHLKGLERMGAVIAIEGGYIHATAPQGLQGADIALPIASVGATENLMMAASLAHGETTITNAAREPEITDLAVCLAAMGADIQGAGESTIHMRGVPRLHAARHQVVADRIEAGTYMIAAAMAGGTVTLQGARCDHLGTFVQKLREAGVILTSRDSGGLRGVDVMTEPYPGFPTDLQAQMMALMTIADGAAMLTETIFENRFMHAPELARMGASITVHQSSALVRGVRQLRGAPVMATDLRASSSLVLAALAAEGETVVNRIYHLDRGYEGMEGKLAACGAQVRRVSGA
jgi:UDP-N-acetylglucosamine 1-carboxyvinyltransferase